MLAIPLLVMAEAIENDTARNQSKILNQACHESQEELQALHFNQREVSLMKRTVIIPKLFYVSFTAKKLYGLEEELHEKLEQCAIEWGKFQRIENMLINPYLIKS